MRRLWSWLFVQRGSWRDDSRWLDQVAFEAVDCWPTLIVRRKDGAIIRGRMTAAAIKDLRDKCTAAIAERAQFLKNEQD